MARQHTAELPRRDSAVPPVPELYSRFRAVILRTAARVVGADAAHDVLQTLFVELLTDGGLGDDVRPANVFGLIVFRARLCAIQHLRRHKHDAAHDDPDLAFAAVRSSALRDHPDVWTYRRELRRRLIAAFCSLPPQMRQATRLRFFKDYTLEELEQALGVRHSRVSTVLQTGKLRLRQALADVYEPTGMPAHYRPHNTQPRRPCR